jgi:hypothetical protein
MSGAGDLVRIDDGATHLLEVELVDRLRAYISGGS